MKRNLQLLRFAAWLLPALLSGSSFAPFALAEPSSAEEWLFGYAETDITPAPGEASMAGYGRERYATGTHDPLRAQALAFRDRRGRTALLITADVIGFDRVFVGALRHKLQAKHDLPPAAICLAASHTHWGPAINYEMNFSLGGLNVWYLEKLETKLIALADDALADLSAASISYGVCKTRIGVNRRLPNAEGEFKMQPNAAGIYDEHTPVLRITREQTKQQFVLAGHACHATTSGLIEQWSADYPGAMRNELEAKLDNCRAAFVMGCGADAKVVNQDSKSNDATFAASPEQSQAAGVKLASAVRNVIENDELVKLDPRLQTKLVRGTLSLQSPKTQRELEEIAFGGDARNYQTWWARQSLAFPNHRRNQSYEVQLWQLGDLTLFALEGEVCADWGEIARSLAKTPHAMVVAYANNVPGYIPTAKIIQEGGYEGDYSHMAYSLPAPFDPVMEKQLKSLLEAAASETIER